MSGLSNPPIELLRTSLRGVVIGWRVSKSDFPTAPEQRPLWISFKANAFNLGTTRAKY
jgi:hypothetical protein